MATLRHRYPDTVFGKPIYTADQMPGDAVYVKAVRSRHPHALVKRIDFSEALKVGGVLHVLTAKDVPGVNLSAGIVFDRPFLAYDRVRCMADAVALVVAEDPLAADEGVERVEVEYEPLPAVMDLVEALKADAPKIHEGGNICKHYRVRKGDIGKGFKESDVILERTYRTQFQEPAPIETEAAYAKPRPDGGLDIVGSIQNPFYVRNGVARILGLPAERVNVVAAALGGTFGGKSDEAPWDVSAMAGLAALYTGRPAVCIYGRDESIVAHSRRHASMIRYRLGATRDGLFKAAEIGVYFDTGAYASVGPLVLLRAIVHATGPYEIENVKADAYLVYTNNLVAGSFRGFGNPQVHFAAESHVDLMARELGMDPVELRLKNCLRKGSVTATGERLEDEVSLEHALRIVADKIGWGEKKHEVSSEIRRGYGVALVYHGNSLGPEGEDSAEAEVAVTPDGLVKVRISLTEYGTGASYGIAKIAAETLGVPENRVVVEKPATDTVPDTGGTFASRSTLMGGNAVRMAAKRLRERLEKMASEAGWPLEQRTIIDFVAETGEEISERAVFKLPICDYDPEKGYGVAYLQYTYGAVGVTVLVDMLTGIVRLEKLVGAFDVGRAINRGFVISQIEGALTQGAAYGLTEELITGKTGRLLNPNFADYLVPTAADMPPVEVVVLENPSPLTPLGTRTIGEPPICGPAPAIANAVHDATGVRIFSLPVTAEKLVKALYNI
ncbi:MAG: xanthine dehydrogenase family protein molybdopterin-binding subunit [Nitrososphaerota archaeon]